MNIIKSVKKCANELFLNNWYSATGAIMVSGVCISVPYFIFYTVLPLLYSVTTGACYDFLYKFLYILPVFVTIPILYGTCVFFYELAENKECDIFHIFHAFGSLYAFSKSYVVAFNLLVRGLIVYSPAIASLFVFFGYSGNLFSLPFEVSFLGYDVVYTVLFSLTLVLFALSSGIITRYFTALYLTIKYDSLPVSYCFTVGAYFNYGEKIKLFITFLKFIPLLVISVLSFGVVFFIYTLPFLLITFMLYGKTICDDNDENFICLEKQNNFSETE